MATVTCGSDKILKVCLQCELWVIESEVTYHGLEEHLSKSLSEANAASTVPRAGARSHALLSCWGQVHRVRWVEPLRADFHWTLPLVRVLCQCIEANLELVTLLEAVFAEGQIFGANLGLAHNCWWLDAQGLLHYHDSVLKLHHALIVDNFLELVSSAEARNAGVLLNGGLGNQRVEFRADFLQNIFPLGQNR